MSLAIIGAGKVGTALAILARKAGIDVVMMASASEASARAAAERVGPGVAVGDPAEAAGAADLVLLTTPDGAIESTCRAIAEAGAFRAGAVVAHCSGLHGRELLRTARERCGCRVGSIHPLQSFPDLDAALDHLPGSYAFIEADAEALAPLRTFAERVGMHAVEIDGRAKVLYHAAAVVACNYLSVLMEVALRLDERAGIERTESWPALEPLVRATLDNIARVGPRDALSGPIARGDVDTVALHLEALRGQAGEFAGLYSALGRVALELTAERGELDATTRSSLQALFEEDAD